jgi:hypothetical protein
MKRKAKRARRKSARHVASYRKGIVSTPLRRALEQCLEPRLNGSRGWSVPTIGKVVGRLANGRVTRSLVRHWCNGTRRAPAWFIAVLDSELARQIEQRQVIRAQLAEYKPLDRAERSRKLAAKARAEMAAGIGAIGQRLARKRKEAAERDARLRAIYPPQGENNAPAGAGVANAAEKTTQ